MQKDQPLNTTPEIIYCPLARRLMAMLYDTVILLGLLILASAAALPFGNVNKVAFHDLWFTLWLLTVCFLYFAGCWRYGGMTVGMRAWKIRLVSSNEKQVTWLRCLLRFLVGSVSLAFFGLGILWALIDQKNRGWHDLAAHTVLLKALQDSGRR